MKLIRGVKPLDFEDLPINLKGRSYTLIRIGDYIEVETTDPELIMYFRSKGLN